METNSDHYNGHQGRSTYSSTQIFEPFAELFEVNDDNYGWHGQSQNSDQFGSPVQCFLFHKVRGGKGEWKEIVQNDMIRVTKGVGKKVKLVVRASFAFKIGELQLTLQDLTEGTKPSRVQESPKDKTSKFQIENTNMKAEGGRTTAEIFIKLFKLSKQLVFQVNILKEGGGSYPGHSPIFGTHNSGKQSKKKDKLDDKDDRKRLEDDHMFDRRLGYDYPSMTQYQQKNLVNRSAAAMKHFGNKVIAEEAKKRNSNFVVYVACKKLKRPPEDFTTFIYKNESLLHQEAVSLGTSMGRAIFLPPDSNGDYSGSYTLVAAIRSKGDPSDNIPPGEGVAALFDFRNENDSMKLIPIQPVLLSSEQTNVWLIGSFYIDGNDATWVQSPQLTVNQTMGMPPQIVNSPIYHQQIHPTKFIQPDPSLYMSSPRQMYGPGPMGYPYQLNQPNKAYMIPPQYYLKQNESSGYPMYSPYIYPQSMSHPNDFRGNR